MSLFNKKNLEGVEDMDYTHIKHEFEPIFDKKSKILILGTLPSVKSREENFYYGHPRNRFWKVISSLVNEEEPKNIQEKREILLKNNIAIWDVISSCDIIGSSDSSIKNVVPSDLSVILNSCDIKAIFANGKTAEKLYNKYIKTKTNMQIIALPSTSPANATYSIEKLTKCWRDNVSSYIN